MPQPSVTVRVSEDAALLRRSTRTRRTCTHFDPTGRAPKQALEGVVASNETGGEALPKRTTKSAALPTEAHAAVRVRIKRNSAWKKSGNTARNNQKKRKVAEPAKAPAPAPSASRSRGGLRPQWWPDWQSKGSAAKLLHDNLDALASGTIDTVPIVCTSRPFHDQMLERFIYGILRKDGDGVRVDYDQPFEGKTQEQFALDANAKNSIRYLVDMSLIYLYDVSSPSPSPPVAPSVGGGVTPAERAKLRRRAARHPHSAEEEEDVK